MTLRILSPCLGRIVDLHSFPRVRDAFLGFHLGLFRLDKTRSQLSQALPQTFQCNARLIELLSRSKAGCQRSLGELLSEYRPYLLQLANQQLPATMQSKLGGSDIVQQTFLNATHSFVQFRGETIDELTPWLIRIVENEAISCRRSFLSDKRNTQKETRLSHDRLADFHDANLLSNETSPSSRILSEERKWLIERAISTLPMHYQEVIELRNRQNLSFTEIGHKIRRTTEASRKLWARAIETLAIAIRSMDISG